MVGLFLCGHAVFEQVAQLWQRDHATRRDFKGWVTLRLNFRLNGYVSHRCV